MPEADHSYAVAPLLTGKSALKLDGVTDVGGWDERKRERRRGGRRMVQERLLSPLSLVAIIKGREAAGDACCCNECLRSPS